MSRKLIQQKPDDPAGYSIPDAAAVQALALGTATPEQQQRAFNWIVYNAANTYGPDYWPDTRDHAFASGKRFVGLQLVGLLKVNLAKLKEKSGLSQG